MATNRQTKRTVLHALLALVEGKDVCVIAHPAAIAFGVALKVAKAARIFGIASEIRDDNGAERTGDDPVIFTRPLGWEPVNYPTWRPKPIVIQHASAQFEKPRTVGPSLRTVITAQR